MRIDLIDTATASAASLLVSLEEVKDWLAGQDEPAHILANVACRVGNRMQCDACSLYRLNRQRRSLILAATVGLRTSCVESLQMDISEGLCGLVLQQAAPVNIAALASAHPRFKYFPEAGEEPYESFLGVPIVDGARVVGVLVVQTVEPRSFSPRDEQLLALTGRQIGPLVASLTWQRESP